jgi:UDPglucose 6-dehydrogenase
MVYKYGGDMKIAQIGNGFVGGALSRSFKEKGVESLIYDKFQEIGSIEAVLNSDVVFLCLPTPYIDNVGFDISAIEENLGALASHCYGGLCVIKSTVEPGTTMSLANKYDLNIAHNPEFLTERTAFDDFHHQKHIVLGKCRDSSLFNALITLYKDLYPEAMISVCTSDESEAMKLFANCFYAQKVMIFNELYMLSEAIGLDFERIKSLMLKNNWISPNHMSVPGPDGRMAYGGHCFPKDTNALNQMMKNMSTPNMVIDAAIRERNKLRDD